MALLHVTQLFTGTITAITPAKTTVYTVPAGHRIVLRHIAARNLASPTTQNLDVYVNGARIHTVVLTSGAGASQDWDTWIVVDEGQTIDLSVNQTLGVNVAVSGYLYFV